METSNSVELAAEVVAAFISNNPLPKSELPALIHAVHSALERLAKAPENAPPQVELRAPAVPVRKSVTPDYLICLEDGKKFKSLRRHLKLHGLTPEQYREKWNLRPDYPVVAPNYTALRSAMARKIGRLVDERTRTSSRRGSGVGCCGPNDYDSCCGSDGRNETAGSPSGASVRKRRRRRSSPSGSWTAFQSSAGAARTTDGDRLCHGALSGLWADLCEPDASGTPWSRGFAGDAPQVDD